MADLIIKNGFVITMDDKRKVIPDGGVAIESNRIVDVDTTNRLIEKHNADRVVDADHKVILPGLVNTHTHLFQTLMKSLADDMTLFEWWPKVIGPLSIHLQRNHCYYAALAGCLELIRSGCTCTVDNHYAHPTKGLADECIKAFTDIGIRGIEAVGTIDAQRSYYPIAQELLMNTEQAISENVRLIEKWNKTANGRIHVWFGTESPYDCSDELLEKAHDLSKKHNVGVSCHLHECDEEVNNWKKETGLTPIQYYDKKIRFLDSNLLAVHCVAVDDYDMEILSSRNVKVSHNPVSNMYLANGVSPVPRLAQSGITIGLGVDGAASNNNQDMFELMKMTVLLHKVVQRDPLAITAEKVLRMATIDGAKTLGLEKEIGSLEPGKKADIILVNLEESNMVAINNIPSQIVYCGKASNVDTAIIDGNIVMENKILMTIDENMVLKKTQEMSDDLIARAGMDDLRKRWRRPTTRQ